MTKPRHPFGMDRLRYEAERNLGPFQNAERYGPIEGREGAFALFVISILEMLTERRGLARFGLSLDSSVAPSPDEQETTVIVKQSVTAIVEGLCPTPIDILEFYRGCFPLNATYKGSFALSRKDPLPQRYFRAVDDGDEDERRAVLALLAFHASQAFSIGGLYIESYAAP